MSEVGGHCDRRLGYRMAQTAAVHHTIPVLASLRGTGLHAVLERALRGDPRWLVEAHVTYGGIGGHVDLYDMRTGTVWDHKLMPRAKIARVLAEGLSRAHRWQAHLYGAGLTVAQHQVRRVGLLMWPSDAHDEQAAAWGEPYDEAVAQTAIAHHDRVARTVLADGPAALAPTVGPLCRWCPYWGPGEPLTDQSCPGKDPPK
jgi:hypothetical protein